MPKKHISELQSRKKARLNTFDSMEHDVYPSLKDNDKVFKIVRDETGKTFPKIRMSWVKIFQSHPDIFPIVYKINDKYVSLERLDTSRALSEHQKLNDILKSNKSHYNTGMYAYVDIISTLDQMFENNDREAESDLDLLFRSKGDKNYTMYYRWKRVIKKFMTLIYDYEPNYVSDLNADQFGYSKDGRLKILDF